MWITKISLEIVLVSMLILPIIILIIGWMVIKNSPTGWEDENGFHFGNKSDDDGD